MWNLEKVTYRITFFFIPIIPYRTDYMLVCPICKCFDALKAKEFEYYQSISKKNPSDTTLSSSEYGDDSAFASDVEKKSSSDESIKSMSKRQRRCSSVRKMEDVQSDQNQSK